MGMKRQIVLAAMLLFALAAIAYPQPDPPQERPGRGKAATELPALIWNPLNFPSGDSLHQTLLTAGYQSTLTDSLALFIDSLANYHLFIIAGIYEHGEWPILREPDFRPFQPAILSFLNSGGRIYWEGAVSLSNIDYQQNDTLGDFFLAGNTLTYTYPFYYLTGSDSTIFGDIDSLGYNSGGDRTDMLISAWRSGLPYVLHAPEAGPSTTTKATVSEVGNTRTMLTNFSWSRLHDGYTDTRVDLIHDVMDWLSGTVGVEDEPGPAMPSAFSLSQNYPNPFNAQTAIEYALPRAAAVKLEIFDILGQRVITLIDGPKPAGYHRATWDASGRSSGLYFYRIVADGESKSRRMTLIK
jgi:hypothetical protein